MSYPLFLPHKDINLSSIRTIQAILDKNPSTPGQALINFLIQPLSNPTDTIPSLQVRGDLSQRGDFLTVTTRLPDGRCHSLSPSRPSVVTYRRNGTLWCLDFLQFGRRHGQPGFILIRSSGVPLKAVYYDQGKVHRQHLPALYYFDEAGNITTAAFYNNGNPVQPIPALPHRPRPSSLQPLQCHMAF